MLFRSLPTQTSAPVSGVFGQQVNKNEPMTGLGGPMPDGMFGNQAKQQQSGSDVSGVFGQQVKGGADQPMTGLGGPTIDGMGGMFGQQVSSKTQPVTGIGDPTPGGMSGVFGQKDVSKTQPVSGLGRPVVDGMGGVFGQQVGAKTQPVSGLGGPVVDGMGGVFGQQTGAKNTQPVTGLGDPMPDGVFGQRSATSDGQWQMGVPGGGPRPSDSGQTQSSLINQPSVGGMQRPPFGAQSAATSPTRPNVLSQAQTAPMPFGSQPIASTPRPTMPGEVYRSQPVAQTLPRPTEIYNAAGGPNATSVPQQGQISNNAPNVPNMMDNVNTGGGYAHGGVARDADSDQSIRRALEIARSMLARHERTPDDYLQ